MSSTTLPLRYIARLTVEAATPLTVGTGEPGLETDELVAVDVNGLPILPGTSLCGVLRNLATKDLEDEAVDALFGYQKRRKRSENEAEGMGSRLILSSGRMIGADGSVLDGLREIDWDHSFYRRFLALPVRDHCRILHRGAADAEGHGKFDEQVVYKGTRFVFEVELVGTEEDEENWDKLLKLLRSPLYRIGGGTRKGFGELEIKHVEARVYDLREKNDLDAYLSKSSSLSEPLAGENVLNADPASDPANWVLYRLDLEPDDFFSFGAGYGDDEADDIPKTESIITWEDGQPSFRDGQLLIPATSVKGALSHRVAFHYNRLTGMTVERVKQKKKEIEEFREPVGKDNPAVRALFGCAKDSKASERDKSEDCKQGLRGRVILSDVFKAPPQTKILNHVSIDRFTGGALDGALFSEKVATKSNGMITLKIHVDPEAFEEDDGTIKTAFECALKDIITGMLPLGGSVMRGHGCFTGRLTLNGEELAHNE